MQAVTQNIFQSNESVRDVRLELDGGEMVKSISFVSETSFDHVNINIHFPISPVGIVLV